MRPVVRIIVDVGSKSVIQDISQKDQSEHEQNPHHRPSNNDELP